MNKRWQLTHISNPKWLGVIAQEPKGTVIKVVRFYTGRPLVLCGYQQSPALFIGLVNNHLIPTATEFFGELQTIQDLLAAEGLPDVAVELQALKNAYRMDLL